MAKRRKRMTAAQVAEKQTELAKVEEPTPQKAEPTVTLVGVIEQRGANPRFRTVEIKLPLSVAEQYITRIRPVDQLAISADVAATWLADGVLR